MVALGLRPGRSRLLGLSCVLFLSRSEFFILTFFMCVCVSECRVELTKYFWGCFVYFNMAPGFFTSTKRLKGKGAGLSARFRESTAARAGLLTDGESHSGASVFFFLNPFI